MGILAGLKKKRNNLMLQAVLAKIAERLFRFQQGFPLGSDEKEVVFMLSPEKKDVNVYIVALGENAEIKRKCAQYKASELVNMLGNRLQDEGLDLASMLPETENGNQALNEECDE